MEQEDTTMDFIKIAAQPRTEHGKGPNSRLRRQGAIPAVAYGKGHQSRSLSVEPKALLQAMRGPYGRNAVMQIAISGEEPFAALLADYSIHPLSREIIHADFLRIALDRPVDVDVPLACTGKAAGVVAGGVLRQIFRTLPLRCLPSDIPTVIEHDVTAMETGHVAKVGDLKLPAGVSVRLPAEQTVITITAPEVAAAAEEGAAASGEAAAAAPAAS